MLSFYAYNARPTTLRSSYEMSGTKIAYAATRERGPCHVGVRFAARLVLRYLAWYSCYAMSGTVLGIVWY